MKHLIKDSGLLKRFMAAAANKDIARLKEIKEEIGRDRWLNHWRASGSKTADWLEPNPFIQFKIMAPH